MNDGCTHIESLLPAFAGQDLGAEDAARVRAHLESCEACRASLASFTALEASLMARRSEVPAVDAYLPKFAAAHAAAAASHRSRLVRVFRSVMTIPGVAIMLAMWAGLLAFNFRVPIGEALSLSTPDNLTGGIGRLADFLVLLTGGNNWLLIGITTLVAIAIAASTSAMTLRFVRR
jgi:predicted anti-sigma-YlaC factor YlaD